MNTLMQNDVSRRTFLKGVGILGATTALGIGFPSVFIKKAIGESNDVVRLGYYDCDHMTAAPIARDAGIFEALGLNVQVAGNGKVPEAMAAGQMDVGYIGFVGMVRAILKGSPMAAVAHNHKGGSMYMVVRKDIEKPEELIGKKLGIGAAPEKQNGWWITFARDNGIPVEGKHYQPFAMADRDKYLALKTGQLDAYYCCDPWGSMAEYEDTGKIMRTFSTFPSNKWGICCAQVMNRDFVKERPKVAEKMVLAHIQALQYIYTQPVKSAEIFSKNYHVPLEVSLMTIYKKTVGETRTLRWNLEKDAYDETIAHNMDIGIFTEAPKYEDIIQTQFLDQKLIPDFDTFIREKVDPVYPYGMKYEDWKKKAYDLKA
ncbi:MAG: ABC transporter substrate-binding subunit SaoX [Pseudomonadota bacterium]